MANEFKVKKGLIVNGEGGTVVDIQGQSGQLFSVTDSLTGVLMSVNDISGLPILEVSSDDTVRMGTFAAEGLIVSGSTIILPNTTNTVGDFLTRNSSSGLVSLRTAAQVLTDIGAQAALTNPVTGTGAAGRVAFWTGTTTQSSDAGLFWDNTNKRLGIGTTSPAAKLDVNGEVFISPNTAGKNTFVLTTNASNDGRLLIKSDTTTKVDIQANGASYFNGGNVGIGTTSPGAKLHNYSTATSNVFISGYGTAAQNDWGGEHAFFVNANNGIIIGKANAQNDTNRLYTFYNDAAGNAEQYIYNTSNTATIKLDSAGDTYFNGGNVGIGTTSPTTKLTVYGGYANFTDGTIDIYSGSDGSGGLFGTITNHYQRFITNNTERMRITSAGLVGIANASPSYTLDVISRFAGEGGVRFWNNRGATSTIDSIAINLHVSNSIGQTGGKIVVSENTADSWPTNMQFYINSATSSYSPTEAMRITSAGNVGIGTTSPNSKLSVNGGDFEFNRGTGNLGNLYLVINKGANNDGGIILRRDNANDWQISNLGGSGNLSFYSYGNSSEVLTILRSNGNVGIGTTSPASMLTLNGTTPFIRIERSGVNTWQIQNNMLSTQTGFSINDITAATTPLFIAQSTGNVGIGTTSPDTPLFVQGGSAGTGGWNRTATLSATYPSLIFNSNGTKWGGMAYDYGAAMRFWVNANNNDIFAGTLAMSILNNGNVGIGETSPAGKLHVNTSGIGTWSPFVVTSTDLWGDGGTQYVTIGAGGAAGIMIFNPHIVWNNNNSSAALRMGRSGGVSSGSWYEIGTGTSDSFFIAKNGFSSEPRLFITSTGNVGIGTTSPNRTLTVNGIVGVTNGTANTQQLVINTDANGAYLTSSYIGSSSYVPMIFETGGAERMRITSSGDVGIGTSSPARKLIVYDTDANVPTIGLRTDGSGTTTSDGFDLQFASSNTFLFNRESGYMAFGTNNAERMRITSAGDVGIGVTGPSERLHVSGRARITTIDNGTGDFATISGTGVITRRTAAEVLVDTNAISNSTDSFTTTDKVVNVVTLTEAEYAALSPKASSTLYIVV